MEKIDKNIGETFTTPEGDKFEVLASPGTDCNACKGCCFRTKIAEEEERSCDLWACDAPQNLMCCKPDRIFKQHNK